MLSINLLRLLAAIAAVETGNNDDVKGLHGERSQYQMKLEVWEFAGGNYHTFLTDCKGRYATEAGLKWLGKLNREAPKQSAAETQHRPWVLAYAWKAGLRGYKESRNPEQNNDYATRVYNLYNDVQFKP